VDAKVRSVDGHGGVPDARTGMSTAPCRRAVAVPAPPEHVTSRSAFLGRARAERDVAVSPYALEPRITGTSAEVTVRDSARRRPTARLALTDTCDGAR
jgi:hypothetical protein